MFIYPIEAQGVYISNRGTGCDRGTGCFNLIKAQDV